MGNGEWGKERDEFRTVAGQPSQCVLPEEQEQETPQSEG